MDVTDEIENGNEQKLKQLTQAAFSDASTRTSWSAIPEVWYSLLKRLEQEVAQSSGIQKQIMQLANNISATPVAGKSVPIMFLIRLAQVSLPSLEETRLRWQVMANLSSGMGPRLSEVGSSVLQELVSANAPATTDIATSSLAAPYLIFVRNTTESASKEDIEKIISYSIALDIVLCGLPVWHREDEGPLVLLSAHIVSAFIKSGLLPKIFRVHGQNLSKLLTLVDTIELLVNSSMTEFEYLQDKEFWASEAGHRSASALKSETRMLIPELLRSIASNERGGDRDLQMWSLTRGVLDIVGSVMTLYPDHILDEYRHELLHEFITLLKATKNLPAVSKLVNAGQEFVPNPSDFPFLRSSVLPAISAMVKADKVAQDEVRISGGLNVILESCVIDANNPFMKERAIMCIRYLLENNVENQEFVATMEARQVVDPQTLEKAGYETEIRNGKITLKKVKS